MQFFTERVAFGLASSDCHAFTMLMYLFNSLVTDHVLLY